MCCGLLHAVAITPVLRVKQQELDHIYALSWCIAAPQGFQQSQDVKTTLPEQLFPMALNWTDAKGVSQRLVIATSLENDRQAWAARASGLRAWLGSGCGRSASATSGYRMGLVVAWSSGRLRIGRWSSEMRPRLRHPLEMSAATVWHLRSMPST